MSCGSVACHKAFRPSRGLNVNYYLYICCTTVMYYINTVCSVACVSSLTAMASSASISTSAASGIRYFDSTNFVRYK
ncbi:hypothetical protein C0J52_18474 [Blattella germanica]|nr:hypothetical protein C0J52_18474 [Blattella germanica]